MSMIDNLSLRPLKDKDAPLMLEWMRDLEVARHFRFESSSATLESVQKFIENSKNMDIDANFAIVNDNDEYLGTVSLKNIDHNAKSAEYAISLRKRAQGCGCGYAATVKILEYAYYSLGLDRVYLNVLSENGVAVKFYERFGFIFEGEFKKHVFIRNEMHSLKWFRLMKNEYETIKDSEQ